MALKVSIVIPTHQRPEQLGALLRTLKAQSLPGEYFEIIIVQTAGDEAQKIANEIFMTTQVKVRCVEIPNDPSHGKSASLKRNYGAYLAEAEWIAFTDDDCEADPHWLEEGVKLFSNSEYGAIEGAVHIPKPKFQTLTYKGLKRLGRFGGYQTCNMFYRKEVFQRVYGFDPRFPFYLEDTDLAWSVLDLGYQIPQCPEAIILHPNVKPEPKRLLDNAKRGGLYYLLKKKHPGRYKNSTMSPWRKVQGAYFLLELFSILFLLVQQWQMLFYSSALLVALLLAHSFKMFWGLKVTPSEFFQTLFFYLVFPWVSLISIIKGRLSYYKERPFGSPLKAMYFTGATGIGGVETFLLNIADYKDFSLYEPVFCLLQSGPLEEQLRKKRS